MRAKAAALLPENGFLAGQLEMLVAPIAHQTVRVCRPNVATATTEIGEEHAKKRVSVGSVGAARAKWDPSGSRAGQVGSCAAKETSLGRVGRLLGARELVVLGILVLEERDGRHRRVRAVDGMVGAANDLLAGRVCHTRTTSSGAAIEL